MIREAIRAAKLDTEFYNTVENDPAYTWRAFVLVVTVSAASGMGAAIGVDSVSLLGGIASYTVTGVVGWMIWSWSAAVIGTRAFGGTTDSGEMLRVLGYAQVPRVIGVIPFLGPVGWAWALIAGVIAVREGQEVTTAKAAVIVVTGGATVVVLTWVIAWVAGRLF